MTDPVTPVAPAMLFVPGSDDRKIGKIPELDADAVILDLEDSVAVSAKAEARRKVAARLRRPAGGPALWVRVNPADGPYFADDIQEIVGPGLAGVLLPKAESAANVTRLDELLMAGEAAHTGITAARIIATVETVAGLRAVEAIAGASPRLDALGFGAGDFSLDAGIDWSLEPDHPLLTAARVESGWPAGRPGLARRTTAPTRGTATSTDSARRPRSRARWALAPSTPSTRARCR